MCQTVSSSQGWSIRCQASFSCASFSQSHVEKRIKEQLSSVLFSPDQHASYRLDNDKESMNDFSQLFLPIVPPVQYGIHLERMLLKTFPFICFIFFSTWFLKCKEHLFFLQIKKKEFCKFVYKKNKIKKNPVPISTVHAQSSPMIRYH